jgi:hypothetical protein
MPSRDIRPFRPGQRNDAKRLELMRQEVFYGRSSSAGGMQSRRGPHGESFWVPPPFGGGACEVILTTTTITGRAGRNPGSGTAKLQTVNGTQLIDGEEITVRNHSAAAGGSWLFGMATEIDGTWWLVNLECGTGGTPPPDPDTPPPPDETEGSEYYAAGYYGSDFYGSGFSGGG